MPIFNPALPGVYLGPYLAAALAAGATNNWAPAGILNAPAVGVTMVGASTITGMAQPANLTVGKVITILNLATNSDHTITVAHQSNDSTSGLRFALPDGTDLVIGAGASASFYYDTAALRWRVYIGAPAPGEINVVQASGQSSGVLETLDLITVPLAPGHMAVCQAAFTVCQVGASTNLGYFYYSGGFVRPINGSDVIRLGNPALLGNGTDPGGYGGFVPELSVVGPANVAFAAKCLFGPLLFAWSCTMTWTDNLVN